MFVSPRFLFGPRRALFLVAIVSLIATFASALLMPAARTSRVDSERKRTAQIEKQIAERTAEIESLNRQASEANAALAVLRDRIIHDELHLNSDAHAEPGAGQLATQTAVVPYIGGAGRTGAALSMFERTSMTRVMSAPRSPKPVNARSGAPATQLRLAKARTDHDRHTLREQHDAAQRALDQLTRAQAHADAAIAAQNAALAHVRSDLTRLASIRKLQKDAQARIAAGRATAAALVATTRSDPARETAARHAPRRQPFEGVYANPLRSVSGLTPERVDAGVDYGGSGPVYAIGNGVVLNVYSGGWPNGVFIAYQLSDGPGKGLVVFTAEDLNPQVSVGTSVTANTVIGQMFGGRHGIEIGWADGSQIPNAMARSYGQYHEGNATAFGYNFSQLLQAVGAPGGIVGNEPTGTLPAGWPQW